MKYVLITTLLVLGSLSFAQVQTPQPSPLAKVEQIVGTTLVNIEYSRPAVRGRKIFGELVSYGEIWRTGANANTKITFADDVTIKGQKVSAGSYALYSRPGENIWEIFFYKKSDNWGTPEKWDSDQVEAVVEIEAEKLSYEVQDFTIAIKNLNFDGADIAIAWSDTELYLPLVVPTEEKVSKSIELTISGNPTSYDFYQAASYYQQTGQNLEQALDWIDKAIEKDTGYWLQRPRALILADLGRYGEAIEAARNSIDLASSAGNLDYVRLNEKSIEEWKEKQVN